MGTIIRENGFRLWGNETPSTEPLNKFPSVRRTHDVVADSIQAAHMWAIDKPFSVQLLVDIAETVNGFLRQLRGRGVPLGGKVWLDPAKNTRETWVAGHLFVDYDAEAPAPMQRITFQFNRNTGYFDELTASAAAEILRETSKPFDRAAAEAAAERAANLRRRDQKLDPSISVEAARLRAPSGRWSDLDALALRRAGVWIMWADGFGFGVTAAEAEALDSRDPDRIPAAARQIVARLAETVGETFGGPDADALLITRAGLIDRLPPID